METNGQKKFNVDGFLADVRHLAGAAVDNGYPSPTPKQLEYYTYLIHKTLKMGYFPPATETLPVSKNPVSGSSWITQRGMSNIIGRLLESIPDLAAAIERERKAACPDCATARKTGVHPNEVMISHEEGQCRRCGAYYSHPDI